jgi:hypothetical protein
MSLFYWQPTGKYTLLSPTWPLSATFLTTTSTYGNIQTGNFSSDEGISVRAYISHLLYQLNQFVADELDPISFPRAASKHRLVVTGLANPWQ